MKNSGSLNLCKPHEETQCNVICTVSKRLSGSGDTCQKRDLKEPVWKCRYVVTLIAFLVQLISVINRIGMSVGVVAMVNNTAVSQRTKAESESCPNLIANSTEDFLIPGFKQEGDFNWSPEIQGYILGCLFVGSLISQIPAGRFAERYGCKGILVFSLMVTSVSTLLIPPFAWWGAFGVIALQVLRGLALGVPGTCVTILIANWSPKNERGFLYSIVHTAFSLASCVANPFVGYVSETIGWSYVFYLLGSITLLLALLVLFFISESPTQHSSISKAELTFILSQQETTLTKKRPKLPWREMLKSVPLYALLFLNFGRCWKYIQFSMSHAIFLGTILHFSIGDNGLLSAIPFFFAFFTSMTASWISGWIEKKKIVSVDYLRKFFILLSSSLYSLFLFGMYIVGCNRSLSVIFAVLSMAVAGVGTPGYAVILQDMSPRFAGTLCAVIDAVVDVAAIMLPLIVGYLTDEMQTLEQWNKVFFIVIGVVLSSSILFIFFGSAKIQPWNFVEEEKKKTEAREMKNDLKNDEC